MVIGRSEILFYVKNKNLIDNFSEECLEGSGYDLRVGKIYRLKTGGFIKKEGVVTPKVEEVSGDPITLKPGDYVLVESLEKVNMPPELLARILPRSSVFRCGCSLMTAVVDPGYKGTLTMGLKNISTHKFKIERGARIAQIIFEKVSGKTKPYSGKYQGGKVV